MTLRHPYSLSIACALHLLVLAAPTAAQQRVPVSPQPERAAVPTAAAAQVPDALTPITLHRGSSATAPEIDGPDTGELNRDPELGLAGDEWGTAALPAILKGNPYRLAFVMGDYVPAPNERIDPDLADRWKSDPDGTTYGFVMFQGRITSAKRAAIAAMGVRLGTHHTFNAMTAVIPMRALAELVASPDVRWVGYAKRHQKLDPNVTALLEDPTSGDTTRRFMIKVFDDDTTDAARKIEISPAGGSLRATTMATYRTLPEGSFQRRLVQLGAKPWTYYEHMQLFVVDLPVAAVPRVADLDFVHYVELDVEVSFEHDRTTRQIGVDRIRAMNLGDGDDSVVGVFDSGQDITHVDTQSKWYAGWGFNGQSPWNASNGHGTHVTGTISAPGAGDVRYRGCAPGIGTQENRRIYIATPWGGPNGTVSNSIAAWAQFVQDVTINGVTTPHPTVVNHSWGWNQGVAPPNGWPGTDSISIAADAAAFDDGQTNVVAAGNSGGTSYANQNYQNMIWPAVSKTALTVANCLSTREDANSFPGRPHWSSSKGPAGDGRMKPNIMAPGRFVNSVLANSGNLYSAGSGTSMATPHVTGVVAGLHERYPDLKTRPAATRALLCATSNPWRNLRSSNQSSDSYTNRQGFGQVDAYKAHFQRDVPGGFLAGRWHATVSAGTAGYAFDLQIPADAERTNFVLTFDEKPASQGAVRACIHDLDLYLDVEPFSAGFNTGEYSSTRAWDTWDWYSNIASIANLRGKTVRVKVFPRVAPTGGDVVRFGVAYSVARGDTTPQASLTATPSTAYVQPNQTLSLTAQVAVPEYVNSNCMLELTQLDGFQATGLDFFERGNIPMSYSSAVPTQFDLGLQGDWYSPLHRRLEWTLRAPNSNGLRTVCVDLTSDNMPVTQQACGQLCVDGIDPTSITGATSLSHPIDQWSNDSNLWVTWNAPSDNGCAGLEGQAWAMSEGVPGTPTSINTGAATNSLFVPVTSSNQDQYFNVRGIDRAGNRGPVASVGPIKVDLDDPVISNLSIDLGASQTQSLSVRLIPSSIDIHSGVASKRYSMDGATWSPWVPFVGPSWIVSMAQFGGNADEGIKTVHAQVIDRAGNISAVRTQTILYFRCPVVSRVVNPTLENVTSEAFEVLGSDLGDIDTVFFSGTPIQSQSATTWVDGYFEIVDDGKIMVHPPQGLRPVTYDIRVASRYCQTPSASSVNVDLVCTQNPIVRTPPELVAGDVLSILIGQGNLPATSIASLVLSQQAIPSVAPGIVSFEVGNSFLSLVFWPGSTPFDSATCSARFDLPTNPTLLGQTWHFEGFAADLQNPNPFPLVTTDVATTVFQ